MSLSRVLVMAGLILGWPASTLLAGPFSKIVVFGDSLSDTGNAFAFAGTGPGSFYNPDTGLFPTPPYFNGRHSNGPVYVEYLATQLGLPAPAPFPLPFGGTNYAFGGAETGSGFSSTFGVPNIGEQIGIFQTGGNTLGGDELIVVYGGANDFQFGGQADPSVPVANLESALSRLAGLGGVNFLIPNLPPLGLTPFARANGLEAQLNALTVAFNGQLEEALNRLESSSPALRISRLDVFGLTLQGIANPATFGLTNLTDPAFNRATGTVVPNPDEYFFWDEVHPTARAHEILGRAAAVTVVPEPSSLVLSLIGMGAIGLVGYVRGRRVQAS
jgi:phospholipase/lecithinase/hemolysin